jgi:hypothetical protein
VSLFSPVNVWGSGIEVSVDGQRQREPVLQNVNQHPGKQVPAVVISKQAGGNGLADLADSAFKDSHGQQTVSVVRDESPAANWSDSWLGYSGYDGVVVTSQEMAGMPAEVSSALWRYAECGGTLLIIGPWEVPHPWRQRVLKSAPLTTYYAGFGQCIVTGAVDPKSLTSAQWSYLKEAFETTQKPWKATPLDSEARNRLFPVADNVGVPVRGLFLMMLLFVVLIGPVNLFVLARKKKKMWLYWTAPLISLVTCLAVSAYSILSEGWYGRARTQAFTILDEGSHRASTIGWTAFYTPLAPGDGLHFSYETEVSPQTERHYYYGGGEAVFKSVDWTGDQHLETGWVTARTPAHFMIRRTEIRRERILVNKGADGSLSVVNGLGARVKALWVAEKDGKMYEATDIEAGATALLRPSQPSRPPAVAFDTLRKAYADDWVRFARFSAPPSDWLNPGTYFALLDSCPFVEEGLRVDDRKAEAVVFGIMKDSTHEN